mmetsp:Transcript_11812/g.32534  ORF Transcript_11812/g.32534 Transcript_11812/m.32534 type:complete len:112 (-) Transcript_11812:109-444(-)
MDRDVHESFCTLVEHAADELDSQIVSSCWTSHMTLLVRKRHQPTNQPSEQAQHDESRQSKRKRGNHTVRVEHTSTLYTARRLARMSNDWKMVCKSVNTCNRRRMMDWRRMK